MQKYGLQLRVQPQQTRKPPRPPRPAPASFRDDEDDDHVEKEISRQAAKNKSLKDIEEQHKKALEEDPSVFDYDGVYDEMKQKIAQPREQDRQERKPKYIKALIKKAEQRQKEHEIIYERKLAKERSKDDHLYAEKDKFITSAYKKKLAEQSKWMEKERLRQLQEEKEDVTKKSDLSDFYFNLGKNVAFGAKDGESRKEGQIELGKPQKLDDRVSTSTSDRGNSSANLKLVLESSMMKGEHQEETSPSPPHKRNSVSFDLKPASDVPVSDNSLREKTSTEQPLANQPIHDHHKRNEDALAAAKERFLARKRAKHQL